MPEQWDLYDKDRKPLGRLHTRGEPLADGEYHIVAEAFVIRPDGSILIDQRHPNKPGGLLWEVTAGSVTTGEDSRTGAVRELKEELGIDVMPNELTLIGSVLCEDSFWDTYVVPRDVKLTELTFQEGEVVDAKFVTIDELDRLFEAGLIFNHMRYPQFRDELGGHVNV